YGVLGGSDHFYVTSPNLDDTEAIREIALNEGVNPIDTLAAVTEAVRTSETASETPAGGGGSALVLLAVRVLVAAAVGWYVYNSRKKREAEKAKQLHEIKQMATEDVVRLGEDVARLEIDLS